MHTFFRLWSRITAPLVGVTQPEKRATIRLVASLALVAAGLQFTFALVRNTMLPDVNTPIRITLSAIGLIIGGVGYWLARRGDVRTPILMAAFLSPLIITLSALVRGASGIENLRYIAVSFMFVSLFLDNRMTILVFLYDTALVLSCPLLSASYSYDMLLQTILSFHLQASILAIVFTRYRTYIEGIRRLAAAENETRFRVAIDASTDGFFVLQAIRQGGRHGAIRDFRLLDINEAGQRQQREISGAGSQPLLPGTLLSEGGHTTFLGSAISEYAGVVENGLPLISEYALPINAPDDPSQQRWFFREVVKVGDGAAITLRDISSSKVASAQGIELGIQREKVQILRSFIQDVSHDFRTPLALMQNANYLLRGYGERLDNQLEQDPLPRQEMRGTIAKMRAQSSSMGKGISHLQKLLDGMLEMTRLDHQPEYTFRPHDLNAIVRTVILDTRPFAEKKNLQFSTEYAAEPLPIHADAVALNRALQSILDNAVQFTPAGGSIFLRTMQVNGLAALEVQDSGVGIEAAEIPKIFERFYRSDQARQIDTGGVGLGLTIALTIIKSHDGGLMVESTPGVGSTFTVSLPLRPAAVT